jgi:hypothetical protein
MEHQQNHNTYGLRTYNFNIILVSTLYEEIYNPNILSISFLEYYPYLKKNKSRLMQSPCCLCVCESPPPPLTFEWLNQSL